jgi:ABC-type glycerol-3-phosphate transport system substrate-binding protein/actin-like ATPase involved in cell morphogenesis
VSYALGIDLGTTYTAAAIHRDGRVETVSLGSHANTIPTVAYARENGEILVGEAALARGLNDPGRYAKEFKRRLGSTTSIVLGGTTYEAEALLGNVLRSVIDTVTTYCGEAPAEVVITHPASWADHRLQRLEQAAQSAGIERASFAAEPVAAAVFYASQERVPDDAVIAVYDLGGGTFDASVLRKVGAGFELVARPEGDDGIGGIDFDRAVLEHVASSLGDEWIRLDLTDGAVASGVERLRRSATSAKELLSDDLEVTVPVALPGINRDVRLTRGEFEARIRPDVESTLDTLERALDNAQMGPTDVDTVLLVGGSSRVPLVGEIVGNGLGRPLAIDAHPKLAICQGAAMVAAERAGLLTPEPEPEPEPEPTPVPAAVPEPEPAAEAPAGLLTPRNLAIAGVALVALVVLGLVLSSGDGGDIVDPPNGVTTTEGPGVSTTLDDQPPEDTELVLPPGDPVTIEFWYPRTDESKDVVTALVDRFQEENPDITVVQTDVPGSRGLLVRLSNLGLENLPNVIGIDYRSIQTMLDYDISVRPDEMISRDDFDPTTLAPIAAAQFSDDEGLFAVPFTPWAGAVYVNLDVLGDAGVDTSGFSEWTTDDLLALCDDIPDLFDFCFTYETGGLIFERILGTSGGFLVDNDNGRAARATAVDFDDELGRASMSFLVDAGVDGLADIGASGRGNFTGFVNRQSGLFFSTTERYAALAAAVEASAEPFEVGVLPIPNLPGTDAAGAIPGGHALWLIDSDDDRKEIASWLLIDFLLEAEQQAEIHEASGTGPANVAAADLLGDFWTNSPIHEDFFELLVGVEPTTATGGPNAPALSAFIGPYGGARDQTVYPMLTDAIEDATAAGGIDADGVFAALVSSANQVIADYTASLDPETGRPTTTTTADGDS